MRQFIIVLTVAACGAAWPFLSISNAAEVETRGPVRSLLEIRQDRVIVQKWDISCAAAALATVLTYGFDDPVSERAVAAGMLRHTAVERVNRRGGFSLLDLKRFAEGRGYTARGYRSLTMDNLMKLENAIVPIDARGYNHFVVYRGVRNGRVMVADPAFGNRTMKLESFKKAWIGGFVFVVRTAAERSGSDGG
jgi:predicted double-glycine peptidase